MKRLRVGIALLVGSCFGHWATAADDAFWLLSYNVRVDFTGETWINRGEVVAETLREHTPEVILIQEASEWMIAEYQKMLPDYYYLVGERSDGHRGDQRWYEFVPIFYHPDRFRVEDHGSFWVGEDPDKPGDTLDNTKHHGRAFTWVVLRDLSSGKQVAIGNIHIHGQRAEVAVELIANRLRAAVGDLPIILAGDYNSLPESAAYHRMVSADDLGFVDARKIAREVRGQRETSMGSGEAVASADLANQKPGNPDRKPRQIDYVFVTPEISVDQFEVQKRAVKPGFYASDHFPIWVKVALP
ncbi:MAG: endonuclease/exonuclease/phosphatase family protein [Synoicihabitans sp.]